MNLRSVLPVALLASFVLPAAAQTTDEEQVQYTLPTDEWYVPKSTLSFGVRVLSKGASVKFGNLGVVDPYVNGPLENGDRAYADGFVKKDSLDSRALEAHTTEITQPGNTEGSYTLYTINDGSGRYQVRRLTRGAAATDGTPGPVTDTPEGDGLSYVAGHSREWQAAGIDQIEGNRVRMTNYSTTSLGGSFEEDEGINPGLEMALARTIGTIGRRIDWGFTAGIAMNTMNAKAGGTVQATLMKRSDYYTIVGTLPTGSFGGPTFGYYPANPTPSNTNLETTAPVVYDPVEEGTPSVVRNVDVQGNWQVKGAYFMIRVGPSLRTQLTQRIGLSASAGVAGAYAGSRYTVVEQIEIPELDGPIIDQRWDADSKVLAGFYADLNLDWAATERTGLFAGVSMQQFGTYEMSVAGRTATIDLGNAIGLRGGISVRF